MDVITVKQLNTYIKSLLEGDVRLYNVMVKGEISNFKNHSSGHFYFNLKYDNSVIKAVMFRSSAVKVKFSPKDGMLVIARGRISVFERDGIYQIYVEEMSLDGEGDLYLAFELLKEKLQAQGIFDQNRKKPIPKIPLNVGVITSPTGAAVRDIINVLGRRFPAAKVMLYPVLVQGDGAAAQICEAIEYFDKTAIADVLIVGRGGGSIEDLWAFNEESVALAIARAKTPIISAVGHETDFTIADFVADLRAPTPSAAAELAVPDTRELMSKFDNLQSRLKMLLSNNLREKRQRMAYVLSSPFLTQPGRLTDDRRVLLDHIAMNITSQMKLKTSTYANTFSALAAKLDSLSPLAVLGRGYSFIKKQDGSIVNSIRQIERGEDITANMTDGSATLTVKGITLTEEK